MNLLNVLEIETKRVKAPGSNPGKEGTSNDHIPEIVGVEEEE